MKIKIFLTLVLFTSLSVLSQKKKVYYKNIIKSCVEKENKKVNKAFFKERNFEKGKKLFENLVNKCVKEKYFYDYTFKTMDGKKINTGDVYKPLLILTSASWCKPCWGEIPALNKLAEKYSDRIEFIVLFWDEKKDIKKMTSKYSKKIHLIPSTKKQKNQSSIDIAGFKHRLDFPGAYLINVDKRILDFDRGAAFPSEKMSVEKANEINEKKLLKLLEPIL